MCGRRESNPHNLLWFLILSQVRLNQLRHVRKICINYIFGLNQILLLHQNFVDPKGIEPSTLSLQGRNASLGTCKPNKAFFFVESSKTTINCWQGGIRTHDGVLLTGLTARTVRPLRQPTNFL